jgi:hypothetical protein
LKGAFDSETHASFGRTAFLNVLLCGQFDRQTRKLRAFNMLQHLKHPKYQDILALLVLFVAAVLFYSVTYNRSSYSYILRADEGISLATAVRVTDGHLPQRDFPFYGLLMPYVYGATFWIFGPSIALMRGVWVCMSIVSILLFYRIGRYVMPPFAAFAGVAMLIGQQHTPLYTYNHVGFVLAAQIILLLWFRRISGLKVPYFQLLLAIWLFVALLVKFNEAFVVLGATFISLWMINSSYARQARPEDPPSPVCLRDVWFSGAFAIGAFVFITAALNIGLTKSQFLRNFPVLPQYQASIGGYRYVALILSVPFKTPWSQMTAQAWYVLWYENYLFAMLVSFAVGILVLFCVLRFAASKKYRIRVQGAWKPALLLAFAVGTYHEFYLTGNHWSAPMYAGFALVVLTYLIWEGLVRVPRIRMTVICGLLALCAASDLYYIKYVCQTYSQYYFDASRARIYSADDSDAPIIAEVVNFLEHEIPSNQPLAAFPHDALLIYLSGHQNAMRDDDYQWMLFPDPESDMEVARELESKKVSKILLSNFIGIKRGEPMIFGKDYLPETFKYIQNHYGVVRTFGDNPQGYQVQYLERMNPIDDTPNTN